MLTNPRDALRGQSRSPNIVPFHMLVIFILCNSNFVLYDIWLQKMLTLKSRSEVTQGHWKWYHSIDWVWFPISVLLKMSIKRTVLDIFDFKNAVTLKTGLGDPSRSLEMSPCNRAHMTSYWCSIVTVAISRVVSEIFNVEKCCDLEIRVKGHLRSLRVVSFDRLCMVSY